MRLPWVPSVRGCMGSRLNGRSFSGFFFGGGGVLPGQNDGGLRHILSKDSPGFALSKFTAPSFHNWPRTPH